MKLYLVVADILESTEIYGCELVCFGIATNHNDLLNLTLAVEDRGYIPIVKEIESDRFIEEELGGYME
jgi:hypothetical protein